MLKWNYQPVKPRSLKPVFISIVREQREQMGEKVAEDVGVINVLSITY